MTKPNPGSPEAQEAGCVCPTMDNHQGKGFMQGDKGPMFWIAGGCPLHGVKKEKPND